MTSLAPQFSPGRAEVPAMSTRSIIIIGVVLPLVALSLGIAGVFRAGSGQAVWPVWPVLISLVALPLAAIVHRRRVRCQSERGTKAQKSNLT